MRHSIAFWFVLGLTYPLCADEADAKRGHEALTTRSFSAPPWKTDAYEQLWKHWQPPLKEKPANYDQTAREYYGLHSAPFENHGLPMGLREGSFLIFKGVSSDCMLCHGGSLLGKSYIGLGNNALDIQSLFQDLNIQSGLPGKLPFTFSNVRGTSEAGAFAVYLYKFRNADLSLRSPPQNFRLQDDLCEDVPAWWLLKKKQTMYFTGTTPARSVRAMMQFMLSPTNARSTFDQEEAAFKHIQAYILSLEAPKYPFAIDTKLAEQGRGVFTENCAKCHGTYGAKGTYPNKVVSLDVVGTDPNRLTHFDPRVTEFYNESWFAQEGDGFKAAEAKGYQAPPLDGIWATAPYFHNGSVPTLAGVLNSKARPRIFTRSFRTDEEAYDKEHVGWKVQDASGLEVKYPIQRRRIYDTTRSGRSNAGHTFGDRLTVEERRAVIEYLKTL